MAGNTNTGADNGEQPLKTPEDIKKSLQTWAAANEQLEQEVNDF